LRGNEIVLAKAGKQSISRILLVLFLYTGLNYSQDTLDFKQYDSLKTSAEDSIINLFRKNLFSDSTKITFNINGDTNKLHTPNSQLSTHDSSFDVRLFRTINNSRTKFKNHFFGLFDRSMIPCAFLVPSSMFIYSRAAEKTYDENSAYLLTVSELTNFFFTVGLKFTVRRLRPFETLANVHHKGKPKFDKYSFPSGHASFTFNMATMFALRYPKYQQVYAPMFAWAMLVSYARPYFGMHYPSDVLAGAVVGAGSALLTYSLRKPLLKFKNNIFAGDGKDEGSLNAGVISFWVGSFILSSVLNEFVFTGKKGMKINFAPHLSYP